MIESESPSIQLRIWLLGPFLLERRTENGIWESVAQKVWNKRGYAYPLLQRLLCTHSRKAERITLIDDLWSDSKKPELLDRYLNDAAYYLRKVLATPDALNTFGNGSGYQLANQSVIWVDVDACDELLKEAERLGRTSPETLPLLEQASHYLLRGGFLEQQMGQWAYARRGSVERMNYRCHLWLAEAYEQLGLPGQAETLYSHLLEDDPADEDILRRLMHLYHQRGMKQLARKCYEDTRQRLHNLKQTFSPDLQAFAQHLLSEPAIIELQTLSSMSIVSPYQLQTGSLSLLATSEDIMSNMKESEGQNLGLSRRYLLQKSLNMAQAALITSAHPLPDPSLLERLSRALARPSNVDEETIRYLEERTHLYWRDRHGAILTSYNLIGYVLELFEKIVTLLEGSLLPTVRRRLCAIVSETAQLLGELFFDMSSVQNEIEYKKIAIIAAQEADNQALEAVAWGRMSFAWTYNNEPQEALKCVQNARHLAVSHANSIACAWLAAVEAEIQSILCDDEACLSALRNANDIEDPQKPDEDSYYLYFDRSLRAGYQGVCFQRLFYLKGGRANEFLTNAQEALIEALEFIDTVAIQRQPTLLTDLAGTYVQQGNFEEAYKYAFQAAMMTMEIKSQTNVQRLLSLRNLTPWKDTQYIQNLDEHLAPLLTPRWFRG